MSQKFLSEVNLQALNNAATDTDRFLVSDSGTIKYRTGSQLLSDLGIAPNSSVRNETTFTATANQTLFTVSYIVGQVDVYYNGSKLVPSEFTATNGTSITLVTPCKVNDIIDVISYLEVLGGGVKWFDYIVGKTSSIDIIVAGGKVQEFSYAGTTEKRYRFISSPYNSATDIIYETFSGGVLSNPIAYRLINL